MEATRKNGTHDLASGVAPMVDRAAEGAHDMVNRAASAANAAARTLEQKTEELKEVQDKYLDVARGSVRDNPIAAIGLALAAGFLLSQFLTRR